MKTEVNLLNGVRFAPDIHTRLHLHTGDVSATVENLVVPKVGPKVLLRKDYLAFPKTGEATPYGTGRNAITSFLFSWDEVSVRNFASTANSDDPLLPEDLGPKEYPDGSGTITLDLTGAFRLSLFIRPDVESVGVDKYALIAGMPGRFGLFQYEDKLVLRVRPDGEDAYDHDHESVLADLVNPPQIWLTVVQQIPERFEA